eukprot:jgi/Hompol1/5933/HPOL_000998-RA
MGWFSSSKPKEEPAAPAPVPAAPVPPPPAPAAVPEIPSDVATQLGNLIPSIIPSGPADIGEIGMASVFGATAGFAAKRMSKRAAFAIGISFMGIQALSQTGLVKVNWPMLEQYIVGHVDQDGDGQLTNKDIQIAATRLLHNLTSDLPAAASFTAAFWVGFRYG